MVGLLPYALTNKAYEVEEGDEEEKLMTCLLPNQVTLFTVSNGLSTLPKNCGLGVLNLGTENGEYQDASNKTATPDKQLKLS